MKAKHILTAIALPAMLAACSQDEDLSGALSQKDYSNIPTVDAAFTASVNDGDVQTRMATKFGWELGDKIGLAWLGDGNEITIDGKAFQNHPLFCTDPVKTSFETKTMLYAGKYYAYMPYNEDVKNIKKVTFNTTDQDLSANQDDYAKRMIYISPKLTELKAAAENPGDVEAGMGKNVKLSLSRLSNAVTVNLTFENTSNFKNLKVTGISVDAQNGGSASVLPASFEYAPTKDNEATDWSTLAANKILAAESAAFYNGAGIGPATASSGAITATSEEGLPVVDGKLTTYILTLAATEAPTKMVFTVTTNYGDVNVEWDGTTGAEKAIVVKDNGDTGAKAIEVAKIFNAFGAAGSMDVTVDMADLSVPATVATQEELNAALDILVIKGETSPTAITVNPAATNEDNTVELTDFTFPEGLKCAVTLTAGVKASSGFVFKGNTVINKQMTLGSDAKVDGTMTIKNIVDGSNEQQATLTTTNSKSLTINAGAKLINEGKISNVASGSIVTSALATDIPAALFVSNTKDATIIGEGTFTNNGEIQWIAGTLPTTVSGTGRVYANIATTDIEQLMNISAFPTNSSGTNEVIFDGSLSIAGASYLTFDWSKISKMTIKGDLTLNLGSTYTVTGLAAINVESGSLNLIGNARTFTPKTGCTLALSKDTKLNVAAGVTLDLGTGSISYEGATVTNNGIITVTSVSGSGTWIGTPFAAPII